MKEKLIVALDKPTLKEAEELLKQLQGIVTYYKIGLELFTSHGWEAVEHVKKYNSRIFLDLKLHDIPNTVAKTSSVIAKHDVDMFNVHALGGLEMMKAARQAVNENSPKGKRAAIIAVTILTSHQESSLSRELGIQNPIEAEVLQLAGLAREAGLDGIVNSPHETARLRGAFHGDFLIVTPGIRPSGSQKGDQERIMTPSEAVKAGSSYLVIGRPITAAQDPANAAQAVIREISS